MAKKTRNSHHARFLAIAGLCLAILSAATLGVNLLVDPLWYLGGNQLFPKNYAFNERLAKPNRLLKDIRRYDCLILGSSRVTLLDETKIAGHRCFNLSISAGSPAEFVFFADWAMKMGMKPDLVIVGIDAGYFTANWPAVSVPDFVREGTPPPDVVSAYLSTDVAKLSLRALHGRSSLPRYYDARFLGAILPSAPVYQPPKDLAREQLRGPYFTADRDHVQILRRIFPEARFIGYVPPVSAWRRARAYQGGTLDGYLKSISAIARLFDRFYDFSVPSDVTRDPTRTYDGSHYNIAINAEIAGALNGHKMTFGLAVHAIGERAYRHAFLEATRKFVRKLKQSRPRS